MIDLDDNRLGLARQFGATQTIDSADRKATDAARTLTGGRGVDTSFHDQYSGHQFRIDRRASPWTSNEALYQPSKGLTLLCKAGAVVIPFCLTGLIRGRRWAGRSNYGGILVRMSYGALQRKLKTVHKSAGC